MRRGPLPKRCRSPSPTSEAPAAGDAAAGTGTEKAPDAPPNDSQITQADAQTLIIFIILTDIELEIQDTVCSPVKWLVPYLLASGAIRRQSGKMTLDLRHFGASQLDWQQLVELMNAYLNCELLRSSRWFLLVEATKNRAVLQSFQGLFEHLEPIWTSLNLVRSAVTEGTIPSYTSSCITDDDDEFLFVPPDCVRFFPFVPNDSLVFVSVTTLQLETELMRNDSMTSEEKLAQKAQRALCESACISLHENLKIVNVDQTVIHAGGTRIICEKKLLIRLGETVGFFSTFVHEGEKRGWTGPPNEQQTTLQMIVFSARIASESSQRVLRPYQNMKDA
jgi:hypothetical protein